jgi:acetyl-CoA acetyltransferase
MSLPPVAIVGVYATQQARSIDRTTESLCLEAVKGALADAGLKMSDIDGIGARREGAMEGGAKPGSMDWATMLGQPVTWVGDTYPAGVPGVLDAVAAIGAGLCHTVLLLGGKSTGPRTDGTVPNYTRPDTEFAGAFGSFTQAQFALVAQRYYDKFRPDREKVANIAASIRNLGAVNPEAVMFKRGPYTAADVLASPLVAEPFHLLETCLANDGAVALVLTSLERARDCRRTPIRVLSGASEWVRKQNLDWPRYEEVGRIGEAAAKKSLGEAGITARDLDVLQLYDANVFEVMRQFEILGYCAEGEGTDLISEKGIGVDGWPINLDGGLLAYSHPGWSAPNLKIVECVRQLRGEAAGRQVPDASLALVAGAGSGAQYYNLAVLGRE